MTFEFQYIPPWKLTRWGFLKAWGKGCDEWHNLGRYIVIPLIGEFVLFRIKYHRSAPQHVHGMTGHQIHGDVVAGCTTCVDILNDMLSDVGGTTFRDDLIADLADPKFLEQWNNDHDPGRFRCTKCGKLDTDHPFLACEDGWWERNKGAR